MHVSHVVETQSLDELRDVEDEDVRWIRPKDANRVLRSQWMRRILSERVEIQKAVAREYKFPLSGRKYEINFFSELKSQAHPKILGQGPITGRLFT